METDAGLAQTWCVNFFFFQMGKSAEPDSFLGKEDARGCWQSREGAALGW
jgi:hypothetical protein